MIYSDYVFLCLAIVGLNFDQKQSKKHWLKHFKWPYTEYIHNDELKSKSFHVFKPVFIWAKPKYYKPNSFVDVSKANIFTNDSLVILSQIYTV